MRAQSGDIAARDELVMRNMRFVLKTAKQVARRHHYKRGDHRVEFSDLVQEGVIALMRAVQMFDPSHDVRFITYAARAIINEMNRRANRAFDLLKTKAEVHRQALPDLSYEDPRHDVHDAVDKLSPKTRDVIVRHYLQGERYKQIAKSYGVCTQRVHQLARNGVRELREHMG